MQIAKGVSKKIENRSTFHRVITGAESFDYFTNRLIDATNRL